MTRLFHKEPILSILIPHLPERGEKLSRLLFQIESQLGNYKAEVLIHDDVKKTTGEKRNDLISDAKGEWVISIDDDDKVSGNYFKSIFKWLYGDVAGIGFIMQVQMHNKKIPSYHCNLIERYRQFPECFFRPLTHINVIRKSLCIPFEHITRGEDIRWANKMYHVLKDKKCIFIPETLYFYDSTHNH